MMCEHPALAKMGRTLILKCLLVIVGLLASFGSTTTSAQKSESADALLEFAVGLGGTSASLENWDPDTDVCTWAGVTCDELGDNVVKLNLSAQVPMLGGFIGASLAKLTTLEEIYLDRNVLTGSIPAALGSLTSLFTLSLYNNHLTGSIPPQLGNCSILENLWLQQNQLSGTIPESLGNLPLLGSLLLADNHLTGELPLTFLSLPCMQQLDLGGNSLSGNLQPAMFSGSTELVQFSVRSNQMTGDIGAGLGEITYLPNIVGVNMENNRFTGISVPSVGNSSTLLELSLGGNQLEGQIPPELANLPNLQRLSLHDNYFVGNIPNEIASMTSLRSLQLGNNSLSGPIPTALGNLVNLEVMELDENAFTGPIPDFLMPNLMVFTARNNYLTGALPLGLIQGASLTSIDVGYNYLEGEVPGVIGSSLEYVDLSWNNFSGMLPVELGANGRIGQLDLSGNNLTGGLFGVNFSQLARNLSVMNLSRNGLNGMIPAVVGMCESLLELDLSYNTFTDMVPPNLELLSNLEVLQLSGNNLTELDPNMYASWASTLLELHLAENPWNTWIAPEIGNLTNLIWLNLSSGGFVGSIPSSLSSLSRLQYLDLSNNNLTGEIPCVFGETMVSLVMVNVSFNRLTGTLPSQWEKFLVANPGGFTGNPNLTLQIDANNSCTGPGHGPSPVSALGGKGGGSKVGVIVGVAVGAALALAIFVAFLSWYCRAAKNETLKLPFSTSKVEAVVVKNLTSEPLPFTFEDIMAATENLSDAYVIGQGCNGVVYKAEVREGKYIVVKKINALNVRNDLVHKSFWKEIDSIGNAKHRNVVRLLGFMKSGEVGFLLYDYVSNGDLRAALHDKKQGPDLNWKARLRIAEGVAHGLSYLHHTFDPPVVHRDITSSNVLLDDDLEAQISDFGLSKVLDRKQKSQAQWSSTSPAVLGTHGYIAPEVGYSNVVTPKMDVYSYGVLLLELLTGKKPADKSFGRSLHVVVWVMEHVRNNNGKMSESVLHESLLDETNLDAREEMLAVQRIALLCTRSFPAERPAMREVVEMFQDISKKNQD